MRAAVLHTPGEAPRYAEHPEPAAERRRPIGMDAYLTVDRNAVYVDPSAPDGAQD